MPEEFTMKDFQALLQNADNCSAGKNYEKALEYMEKALDKVGELLDAGVFDDTDKVEMFDFGEPFETLLYIKLFSPEKQPRGTLLRLSQIYRKYGSVLFNLGRYEDAREAFREAMRWNPVDCPIAFAYMETFKMTGELGTFAELAVQAFEIAFRPADLARCYNNMAFIFESREEYPQAAACLFMSLNYEKSEKITAELEYINEKADTTFTSPTAAQLKEYSEKYGFPIGPSPTVIKLSLAAGKRFYEQGNKELARYYLTIAFGVTHDKRVAELIKKLD